MLQEVGGYATMDKLCRFNTALNLPCACRPGLSNSATRNDSRKQGLVGRQPVAEQRVNQMDQLFSETLHAITTGGPEHSAREGLYGFGSGEGQEYLNVQGEQNKWLNTADTSLGPICLKI